MKGADFGYEMTCDETMGADFSSITLQNGSRGEEVKALQAKLLANGFDPNGIDGIFGPNTATALNGYKAKVGLPQNGVADSAVFASLGLSGDVASASTSAVSSISNIRSIASSSGIDKKKIAMIGIPVTAIGLIGFILWKRKK